MYTRFTIIVKVSSEKFFFLIFYIFPSISRLIIHTKCTTPYVSTTHPVQCLVFLLWLTDIFCPVGRLIGLIGLHTVSCSPKVDILHHNPVQNCTLYCFSFSLARYILSYFITRLPTYPVYNTVCLAPVLAIIVYIILYTSQVYKKVYHTANLLQCLAFFFLHLLGFYPMLSYPIVFQIPFIACQ